MQAHVEGIWRDGGWRDGGSGQGDCPVLALEQNNRKEDRAKRSLPGSPPPTPFGIREERKRKMGARFLRNELNPGLRASKVGNFRQVLDPRCWTGARIGRDWLCF